MRDNAVTVGFTDESFATPRRLPRAELLTEIAHYEAERDNPQHHPQRRAMAADDVATLRAELLADRSCLGCGRPEDEKSDKPGEIAAREVCWLCELFGAGLGPAAFGQAEGSVTD